MNQASHYVDLIDWIVGPVESLQAYTATLARDIEVEDTGVISLRWRCGALGSMNVTMLTYPRHMNVSITVLGENGTVRIDGVAVNEVQQWEFAEPFSFMATAEAIVLTGATSVFADIDPVSCNIDSTLVERLVTNLQESKVSL